jgi:hypothetical protein
MTPFELVIAFALVMAIAIRTIEARAAIGIRRIEREANGRIDAAIAHAESVLEALRRAP